MNLEEKDVEDVEKMMDEELKKWEAEFKAYVSAYPNYCETCKGKGGEVERYDPSPDGVGLSPGYFAFWWECEDCVGQGICPRCAKPLRGEKGQHVCAACGWDEKKDAGIGAPPYPF